MNWWLLKDGVAIFAYVLTLLVFVWRLDAGRGTKCLWSICLFPAFFKLLLFKWLGLDLLSPDVPAVVEWIWSGFLVGAMVLCVLSVVFFFRFPGKTLILPVVSLGLAAWGGWNGVCLPEVKVVELEFPNLPSSLEGYRILQISDLHSSSAAQCWRTRAIVDAANEQKADLICLTGDLADGPVARQAAHLVPLNELRSRDGVFACTGNHEYFYGFLEWKAFYERLGIRFLENESVAPRPGLVLGGVPDPHGAARGLDVAPDVHQAFALAGNGDFRVLLQHRPEHAGENAKKENVSLQLSGHTHGGIAPGIRWMVARLNDGYACGLYRHGDSVLYVSPGSGQCEWMPARFFNPSEITVFVLRRRKLQTDN